MCVDVVQIPQQIHILHKFPRVLEKKLPWKEWKHSFKVWTSFVSLALRKMLANRDILEPVVEQTSDLVREEEFANLVKELGFLRATSDEENVESSTPAKRSSARVESVMTCPNGDKSPLARSVMQLLVSGDHADLTFVLNRADVTHCSTCAKYEANKSEIPAHRVIVATRCSWFKRALLSGMKESIERRILLPDTSPCLFYKFLEYLYSGILDTRSLSLDEVTDLLALSDKYEMDSLKEICEAMLLRDIGEDTVLLYLGVAEQFTVHRLKEQCLRYITTHPDVMESEIFEELPDQLKQEITDKVHRNMPKVITFAEDVRQALALSIQTCLTWPSSLFSQPHFQGLSSPPPLSSTKEAEKRYPGNEAVFSPVTTLGDFEELINCNRDDSDDDDDNDVMPAGNNQVERCIEVLRGVLGDAVPRRELVRVTVAADCDPNRALNFYFA
ncbi:BTB/POZ domain-containing protein 19-like [Montipora capricornis]|uniref:BTB/POZ domain-containing protein 19-like n=1 Tax=Montipora capricornis TaxID=246305 RepID=UPI0035F12D3E